LLYYLTTIFVTSIPDLFKNHREFVVLCNLPLYLRIKHPTCYALCDFVLVRKLSHFRAQNIAWAVFCTNLEGTTSSFPKHSDHHWCALCTSDLTRAFERALTSLLEAEVF
jgi:hypothetical protein